MPPKIPNGKVYQAKFKLKLDRKDKKKNTMGKKDQKNNFKK